MKVKTKTTYEWRGKEYSSLPQVNDDVHAAIDRKLRMNCPQFNSADPRIRAEVHDCLVKFKEDFIDLLSTSYDVEPESIQDEGERSIFNLDSQ